MSRNLRVLFWDLETAPMLAYLWGARADWVRSELFTHESFIMSWAAKWHGSSRTLSGVLTPEEAREQDDTRIVQAMADLVREADVVVAHNGNQFDWKKLNGRVVTHSLPPLPPVKKIDTLRLAKDNFGFTHNSLDHLARHFGIPSKLKTDFDLWRRSYHGDEQALRRMDRYCRRDVRVLEKVYDRMAPYVRSLPRLVEATRDGEVCCNHCGSDDIQWRGVAHTNTLTYRRFTCNGCGRWQRDRTAIKVKASQVPLT